MAEEITWRSSVGRSKGQHIVTYKSDGTTTKELQDLDEPYTLRLTAKCVDVDKLHKLEKDIAQKIAKLGGQQVLDDFDEE